MTYIQNELSEWEHVADSYAQSTGINCMSILSEDIADIPINRLDTYGLSDLNINYSEASKRLHAYGAAMAENLGTHYIYMTEHELCYFIAVIKSVEGTVGHMIGGPVIMSETEDILSNYPQYDVDTQLLINCLNKIPRCSPTKLRCLAEILEHLAKSLSSRNAYIEQQELAEQQSAISTYIQVYKDKGNDAVYPIDKEDDLLRSIEFGDQEQSRRLLNDILGYIYFSSGNNLSIIKTRVTELIVLLSRSAVKGGADPKVIFGLSDQYIQDINNFSSIEQLSRWLAKALNKFSERVIEASNQRAGGLKLALRYIRENITQKITLEEVASKVYLTPSYFSRVFRNQFGYTFSDYVINMRVDLAKRLLMNPHLTLLDVSELSGFQDQSYFTKTFKALTGYTPKQYRNLKNNNFMED